MYIDLHNHFLPGVDDGLSKMEETLIGLRKAVSEKISRLCFTPHIWEGKYPNSPQKLLEVFAAVKEAARDIPIKLHLASEVFYSHSLSDDYGRGLYLPYGEKKRYLLVEFSTAVLPAGAEEGLYKLMLQGVEPVIAHPERYSYAQRKIETLFNFARNQAPMQVTTQAITGSLGSKAQKTALKLLDMGLVSFVASDAHDFIKRPLLFREAVRILDRRYGHTAARLLTMENPKRVLEGRPLLPVPGKNGKRSPFL